MNETGAAAFIPRIRTHRGVMAVQHVPQLQRRRTHDPMHHQVLALMKKGELKKTCPVAWSSILKHGVKPARLIYVALLLH